MAASEDQGVVRAVEQLRHETEPVAVVNERWLQKLREFLSLVGSQNKLAKMLGVSRPYLGRVLSGEKPITAGMIERLRAISSRPMWRQSMALRA
jgi:plasmid maintenance system antidote protein VapI